MALVCIAVFGIFFFSFLCFHISPYPSVEETRHRFNIKNGFRVLVREY